MADRRNSDNLGKYKLIILVIITLALFIYSHINQLRDSDPMPVSSEYESGIMQVAFIDVGQGDSAFIKLSGGENVLIDGGDKGCGELLRKYFANNSIDKLDAAVVSHYHADHAEGIYELMSEFPIDILYMPDSETKPELHDDLKRKAEANGITVKYIAAGDSLSFNDGTVFKILFPDKSIFSNPAEKTNINNDSLLIKVSYGESDFLFTGDLESDAEKAIVNNVKGLDCEVLKVGHHGSKTSASKEFLTAVSPEYTVISAGKNNRYKHPHAQTLDRLEEFGTKIYRTDINGTVTFKADLKGITEINTSEGGGEENAS